MFDLIELIIKWPESLLLWLAMIEATVNCQEGMEHYRCHHVIDISLKMAAIFLATKSNYLDLIIIQSGFTHKNGGKNSN